MAQLRICCVFLVWFVVYGRAQVDDYNRVNAEYLAAYTDANGTVTKTNSVEFQCGSASATPSSTEYTLNATHGVDGAIYLTRVDCKTPQVLYTEVLVGWIPPKVEVYSGLVVRSSSSIFNGTNTTQITPYTLNGEEKRLAAAKGRIGTTFKDGRYYLTNDTLELPTDLILDDDFQVSPYAGVFSDDGSLAHVRKLLQSHPKSSRHSSTRGHEFVFMAGREGIVHAESGDVLTRKSVNRAKVFAHVLRTEALKQRMAAKSFFGDGGPPMQTTSRLNIGITIATGGLGLAYDALAGGDDDDGDSKKPPDMNKAINAWMRSNGLTIEAFKSIDGALNRIEQLAQSQTALNSAEAARNHRMVSMIRLMQEEAAHSRDALDALHQRVKGEAEAVAQNFTIMKDTLEAEITAGVGGLYTWTAGEINNLRGNVTERFNTTATQLNVAMAIIQGQIHRVDARVYDQEKLFSRYVQAAEVDRNGIRMSHSISMTFHLMVEDAKANGLTPWLIDEGTKPWHDPSVFDPEDAVVLVDEMIWVHPRDFDPTTGAQGPQCSTGHTGYGGNSYTCATAVEYSYKLRCNAEFMNAFTHADLPWSFLVMNLYARSCNTTHPSEAQFLDSQMPCKCWVEKRLVATCPTDFWPITTSDLRGLESAPGRLTSGSDYCKRVAWEYVRLGSGPQFIDQDVTYYGDDDTYLTVFTDWETFQSELVSMCAITPSLQFATESHMGPTAWDTGDPNLIVNTAHIIGLPVQTEDVMMHFSSAHHNMFHQVRYNPNDTCETNEASITLQHMLEPNTQSVWLFVTPIAWNLAYSTDLQEYADRRYGTVGQGVHIETYSASSLGHIVQEVNRITFVAVPNDAKMIPVYMIVPRSVEKHATFKILSPLGTGFGDETRIPAIFEADFAFVSPAQVMRVGYKKCTTQDTEDPDCDYPVRDGLEGYTFDPPQELLSTGDLPGLLPMMAPASWDGANVMYDMTSWALAHNATRFNPHDASYSLSDFYTPLTPGTRICDTDGGIQVNGFWCTVLGKMYWRPHGDADCAGADTCLAYRDWRMRAQFTVPFGQFQTTRIYGCPIVEVIPQTFGTILVTMRNMDTHNNTEFITYSVLRNDVAFLGPHSTNIQFGETFPFRVHGTKDGALYTLVISSGNKLCRRSNLTFAQQHAVVAHTAATHEIRTEVDRAETATQFLGTDNAASVIRLVLSLHETYDLKFQAIGFKPLPTTDDEMDRIKADMKAAGANANFTHFNGTEFDIKIDADLAAAARDAANATNLLDEIDHMDDNIDVLVSRVANDTQAVNESVREAHVRLVAAEEGLSDLNKILSQLKDAQDCGMFDWCTLKGVVVTLGILLVVGLGAYGIYRTKHKLSGKPDPMIQMMKMDDDDLDMEMGDDDETLEGVDDDPELAALADAQDAEVAKDATQQIAVAPTPAPVPKGPTGIPATIDTAAVASLPNATPAASPPVGPAVAGPLRTNVHLRFGFEG